MDSNKLQLTFEQRSQANLDKDFVFNKALSILPLLGYVVTNKSSGYIAFEDKDKALMAPMFISNNKLRKGEIYLKTKDETEVILKHNIPLVSHMVFTIIPILLSFALWTPAFLILIFFNVFGFFMTIDQQKRNAITLLEKIIKDCNVY